MSVLCRDESSDQRGLSKTGRSGCMLPLLMRASRACYRLYNELTYQTYLHPVIMQLILQCCMSIGNKCS